MAMSEAELIEAHNHSFKNRAEIEDSDECGCFYCGEIFESSDIDEYTDNGETAKCPNCGIDSVIGDASGIKIDSETLDAMMDRWFGNSEE